MRQFQATYSFLNTKRTCRIHVLTEEELDKTGVWFAINAKRLLNPYISETINSQ
jgi:hypothetical protein